LGKVLINLEFCFKFLSCKKEKSVNILKYSFSFEQKMKIKLPWASGNSVVLVIVLVAAGIICIGVGGFSWLENTKNKGLQQVEEAKKEPKIYVNGHGM
jgi:hypothetical protein